MRNIQAMTRTRIDSSLPAFKPEIHYTWGEAMQLFGVDFTLKMIRSGIRPRKVDAHRWIRNGGKS